MNYNIHCNKSQIEKNIERFLEDGPFKIRGIQTYYPIMDHYYYFSPNKINYNLEFKNRYKILNLIDKNNRSNKYNYSTNKIYHSDVYDMATRTKKRNKIFFKINSILNPISFIMNKYSNEENISLPFYKKYHMNRINKLLNKNNTAYIDSFCTFICSKLVDNNLCPNFPKYFGSYCGIMDEYWFDMTDEYDIYQDKDWFKKYLKEGKFRIHKSTKMEDSQYNQDSININYLSTSNKNIIDNDFIKKLDILKFDKYDKHSFDIKSLDDISNEDNFSSKGMDEFFNVSNNEDMISNCQVDSMITINGDNILETENNLIDSLSDLSSTSVSNNSISCEPELLVYGIIKNIPVNTIITECLDGTLEHILSKDKQELEMVKEIDIYKSEEFKKIELRWISYMWQIIFALAITQKYLKFTHNDLHSNNIMYSETNIKYLYYQINDRYYRVPTNGYILKIIDFGRAVFKINKKIYFSDVFEFNGDAGEQYSYPFEKNKMERVYPNMSFDLSRLSSSIFEDLFPLQIDENEYETCLYSDKDNLYHLLLSWIKDKNGNLVTRYDDFNLYKTIARNVISSVPKEQFNKKIFDVFEVKYEIIEKEHIYRY